MLLTIVLALLLLVLGYFTVLALGGLAWDKLRGNTEFDVTVKTALKRLDPDLSKDPRRRRWQKKALARLTTIYNDMPEFICKEIHIDYVNRMANDMMVEAGLEIDDET